MQKKKFEEIDLLDILIFFWNKKILILTFSVIGLLIGYFLSLSVEPSYENTHKIYFHDNKENIINKNLNINAFEMYFRSALSRERQNQFLMSKFSINEEEASSISSSFMINDDLNAKWVKIKHVNQIKKYSEDKISYEYAKYIRDHINDTIENLIAKNIELLNLEYVIEEERIKKEVAIEKNLENKRNELRKNLIIKNIKIAEELNITSPSNLLDMFDTQPNQVYAFVTEEFSDEYLNEENILFLYGTIILNSILDNINYGTEIAVVNNTIQLEKIKYEKDLNMLETKLFYEYNSIDINNINLIRVSSADNHSSVKVASKYYTYIGLIVGLFLGLAFSIIYSGLMSRFASEE